MDRNAFERAWPRLAAALALVALAVVLSACGSSGASQGAAGEGGEEGDPSRLTLNIPVQADALDTTKASVGSLGVLLLGLEPLITYDPANETVRPNLASKVLEDGPLVYRYKLRSGVKFWDGKPLTVDDVIFSYELHRGEATESFIAQQWAPVKSVEATGSDEITITLTEPNPQFAFTLAETGILEKAYYEAHAENIGSPGVLNMGTGPYRFQSFTPSAETVLVRNKSYWGKEPPIEELVLRTISDESQLLLAASSGELDGVVGIPVSQVPSFEKLPELGLSGTQEYSVYKFNFDLTKKPWDDEHLRRAFAYAVDRDAIANGLFKGNAEAAVTLDPPSVLSELLPRTKVDAEYKRIAEIVPSFDLAAAKREMAKSSVPDGVETTLVVTGSDPNLAEIAQVAAQNLSRVGIKLNVKQVDDNTYYNAVYFKHTTEGVSLENFGSSGPDPANIPNEVLNSANGYPQGSGVNIANYENPQVDALLARGNRLPQDDPQRGELVIQAETLAARETPYVTLAYPNITLGLRSGLEWPQFNTFWWMSRWPYEVTTG